MSACWINRIREICGSNAHNTLAPARIRYANRKRRCIRQSTRRTRVRVRKAVTIANAASTGQTILFSILLSIIALSVGCGLVKKYSSGPNTVANKQANKGVTADATEALASALCALYSGILLTRSRGLLSWIVLGKDLRSCGF